jgi:hypothetical protein
LPFVTSGGKIKTGKFLGRKVSAWFPWHSGSSIGKTWHQQRQPGRLPSSSTPPYLHSILEVWSHPRSIVRISSVNTCLRQLTKGPDALIMLQLHRTAELHRTFKLVL